MKIAIFFIIICSCFTNISATNIFPGQVRGKWTADGNPYYILGNINVEVGDTLQIKPGVIIYFTGNFSLSVFGDLFAVGTEDSLITISSGNNPIPGDWDKIHFYNSGSNDIIEYTTIRGAQNGIKIETDSDLNNSRVAPKIDRCIFSDNVVGIYVYGNADCKCFSEIEVFAEPIISNSIFKSNETGIYIYGRASASYHYPKLRSHASPRIYNCIFDNNTHSVECMVRTYRQWNQQNTNAYSSPIFANNLFRNCEQGINFYAEANPPGHIGIIEAQINSTIYDSCTTGIYASTGGSGKINLHINNTIFNECSYGIDLVDPSNIAVAFQNNDFWNNSNDCQGCATLFGRKSLFNANNDSCDIFYNVFVNPDFVDPKEQDYQLKSSSHLVDAGTKDTSGLVMPRQDLGHKLRIWDGNNDGIKVIDIGCYEFNAPLCNEVEIDEFVTICSGESYYGWTENGVYQRNLATSFGCDSIINVHLSINDLPIPEVVISGDTLISLYEFNNYQWSDQKGIIAGATSRKLVLNNKGIYFLKVTDSYGCSAVSEGFEILCLNSEETEDISICEGENYNGWTESGTYNTFLTSLLGCDSVITTNLIVHGLPNPDFTHDQDTLTSVENYISYQWYNQDGKIEGASFKQYIIEESGTYYLEVVDTNGCSVKSNGMYLIRTINNSYNKNHFNIVVMPNPNDGNFKLRFENVKTGNFHVQLINELGQLKFEKDIYLNRNSHSHEFNLSQLSKGNYFIRIFNDEITETKKIVLK